MPDVYVDPDDRACSYAVPPTACEGIDCDCDDNRPDVHIDPTCPVHGHWVWTPTEETADA